MRAVKLLNLARGTALLAVTAVLSLGCGMTDADPVQPEPPRLGCQTLPAPTAEPFTAASDFGELESGSLHQWQPQGRWFVTGIDDPADTLVTASRHPSAPSNEFTLNGVIGSFDSHAGFVRQAVEREATSFVRAQRISNRQPDGTMQFDSAECDNGACRVCRARLVSAARLADETESQKLVKLGQYRDPTWTASDRTLNVRVLGNYAYLVRDNGLSIIDIRDPARPTNIGHWVNGYSNDVKLVSAGAKTYALIADSPSKIVDVTDPTQPVTVGAAHEPAHTVFTETRNGRTYAYWGGLTGACPVDDVTDPLHPIRLGSFQTAGSYVHDMMIDQGIGYLNAWDAGLYRVDFQNPAVPVETGRWAATPKRRSHSSWATVAGGRKLVLHGDEAAGAYLSVVDAEPGSPTFMQEIGSYQTRAETSIHNIMAIGDRAYITYYHDGVRILDLADPTQPKLLGYYNTWSPDEAVIGNSLFESAIGIDVDPVTRRLYVADVQRGLLIFQDQTSP